MLEHIITKDYICEESHALGVFTNLGTYQFPIVYHQWEGLLHKYATAQLLYQYRCSMTNMWATVDSPDRGHALQHDVSCDSAYLWSRLGDEEIMQMEYMNTSMQIVV